MPEINTQPYRIQLAQKVAEFLPKLKIKAAGLPYGSEQEVVYDDAMIYYDEPEDDMYEVQIPFVLIYRSPIKDAPGYSVMPQRSETITPGE